MQATDWMSGSLIGLLWGDAERAGRCHIDEFVQVRWELLQEQHEIPARGIVEKGDGRNQQGFDRGRTTYESGGRPRDLTVEEPAHSASQPKRGPNSCLTQIDNGGQRDMQLKDCAGLDKCTQRGVLALTEMARELSERDALVGCDVESRIARPIPAVISHPSGKTGVKYAERGIRGDMSNADAAPRVDMRIERAQLGTPS